MTMNQLPDFKKELEKAGKTEMDGYCLFVDEIDAVVTRQIINPLNQTPAQAEKNKK